MGFLPELYYGHVVDQTNIGLINLIGIIYDINILIPQIYDYIDIILVKSPSNGIYARGWVWFEIKWQLDVLNGWYSSMPIFPLACDVLLRLTVGLVFFAYPTPVLDMVLLVLPT